MRGGRAAGDAWRPSGRRCVAAGRRGCVAAADAGRPRCCVAGAAWRGLSGHRRERGFHCDIGALAVCVGSALAAWQKRRPVNASCAALAQGGGRIGRSGRPVRSLIAPPTRRGSPAMAMVWARVSGAGPKPSPRSAARSRWRYLPRSKGFRRGQGRHGTRVCPRKGHCLRWAWFGPRMPSRRRSGPSLRLGG